MPVIDEEKGVYYDENTGEVVAVYEKEQESFLKNIPESLRGAVKVITGACRREASQVTIRVELRKTGKGNYFLVREQVNDPWSEIDEPDTRSGLEHSVTEGISPLSEEEAKEWHKDNISDPEEFQEIFDVELEEA